MKNNELINAYFDGELSEIEKESFIKKLESDPALKNEFDFQSQVIEGIKTARKAELKARLDAVSIGGTGSSGSTSWLKIAAISGIATIGALTYYSINDTEQEVIQVAPKQIEESVEDFIIEDVNENSEADNQSSNSTQPILPIEESISVLASKDQVKVHKPDINKPEIIEPLEIESSEESELVPESGFAEEAPARLSNIAIEVDNSKKKYTFHYQIQDGKLYLFGDFDKGLYEILEFNSSEGKLLYLYYKQAYYDLKQSATDITVLKEISEPNLINKLESVRKDIRN